MTLKAINIAVILIAILCSLECGCTGKGSQAAAAGGGNQNKPSDNATGGAQVPVSDRSSGAPAITVETLGQSVQGRDIKAIIMGSGDAHILMFACIHGDESRGGDLLAEYKNHLAAHPELLDGLKVWIILQANPDGVALNTRDNAHHIDINRNFDASNFKPGKAGDRYSGGDKPLSEPESQILAKLVSDIGPERILSIHTPLNEVNWDGPAEKLAKMMANAGHMNLSASIGYPTPGSFGSWAGGDKHIPVHYARVDKRRLELGCAIEEAYRNARHISSQSYRYGQSSMTYAGKVDSFGPSGVISIIVGMTHDACRGRSRGAFSIS